MFHSKSTDIIKKKIKDMALETGHIRVLICTNAAGMGVNFRELHHVIHYGPPREIDTFVQQLGRAGRDGEKSYHLLLYNNRQLRYIEPDMLTYVRNIDKCRRELIVSMYSRQGCKQSDIRHHCCDICASKLCLMSECSMKHPYLPCESDEECETMELNVRTSTPQTRELLQTSLNEYRTNLNSNKTLGLASDLFHGFSDHVVEEIIKNCNILSCPDDLMSEVNLWSFDHAKDVMAIINKIFEEESIQVDMIDEDDE